LSLCHWSVWPIRWCNGRPAAIYGGCADTSSCQKSSFNS